MEQKLVTCDICKHTETLNSYEYANDFVTITFEIKYGNSQFDAQKKSIQMCRECAEKLSVNMNLSDGNGYKTFKQELDTPQKVFNLILEVLQEAGVRFDD